MRRTALIAFLLSMVAALLLAQTAQPPAKSTILYRKVAALPPAAEQAMASINPGKDSLRR